MKIEDILLNGFFNYRIFRFLIDVVVFFYLTFLFFFFFEDTFSFYQFILFCLFYHKSLLWTFTVALCPFCGFCIWRGRLRDFKVLIVAISGSAGCRMSSYVCCGGSFYLIVTFGGCTRPPAASGVIDVVWEGGVAWSFSDIFLLMKQKNYVKLKYSVKIMIFFQPLRFYVKSICPVL